jgi:hypothetical protein
MRGAVGAEVARVGYVFKCTHRLLEERGQRGARERARWQLQKFCLQRVCTTAAAAAQAKLDRFKEHLKQEEIMSKSIPVPKKGHGW